MKNIKTLEDFNKLVEDTKNQNGYKEPIGFGITRCDMGQKNKNKVLQSTYAVLNWGENFGSAAVFIKALNENGVKIDFNKSEFISNIDENIVDSMLSYFNPFIGEAYEDKHQNIQAVSELKKIAIKGNLDSRYRLVFLFEDTKPQSVESVYLKLYALSLKKAPLRTLNLDGAFGLLTNVAWSGNNPIELEYLRENEIRLKLNGVYPKIDMIDKFPRLLGHIILADNSRILDSSKVRMGAAIADGTTVMPGASYINFNAGTLGAVMVEGRISSSAIVGSGSDIGGGASILGVLSGTDGDPISIGENTLLGANSTTGISLGDGCILDGGLAIFAGTKIYINDENIRAIEEINSGTKLSNDIKAIELSGLHGIHFRLDSTNGKVIAKRSTKEIKLNKELH
jgi:2,3,4,5-tetrahydropyridine-2-carboxylate N-succinyltransferase